MIVSLDKELSLAFQILAQRWLAGLLKQRAQRHIRTPTCRKFRSVNPPERAELRVPVLTTDLPVRISMSVIETL
jgi:hypothetical protein